MNCVRPALARTDLPDDAPRRRHLVVLRCGRLALAHLDGPPAVGSRLRGE